jgi:hypothetical protein
MTRSTISKAADGKSRGSNTKTTPKPKAHSTHRRNAKKTAVEKARGQNGRTAEELAHFTQMPASIRSLAEESVAQTRELYERSLASALESWERFVDAAGQGAVALNHKAIDIAQRNIKAGFSLAEGLAGAKNLAEAMELQASYWRKQLSELAAQSEEIRSLSTRVTFNVGAPLKAQVKRGMHGLQRTL